LRPEAPATCLLRDAKFGALPGCGALRRSKLTLLTAAPLPAPASFKLSGSYPIDPFDDRNLRMLAVAEITPEHAAAAFPAYLIAGTPVRFDAGRRLYRSMGLSLTCPAGLASG
jgi:hypothetical protein